MLIARLIVVWWVTLPVRVVTAVILAVRLARWLLWFPPGWRVSLWLGIVACLEIVLVGRHWLERHIPKEK